MIRRTLAHYRLRRKIGAGGMGEVWEAEDTRLQRSVALKLLPADLAADEERLARFRREALSQAALDHPNVVPLYSVEEAEGVHFLVMPLVDGRTLDALIPADGFPLERLLALAATVAGALAAAHAKGIVHRDLKPGNIMVGEDGRLRVLDFGLARIDPPAAEGGASEQRTATLTSFGKVVGTVPYMSPEQIKGQPAGPRSDVFSLGVLLYEMATGRRPFTGATPMDLASATLRDAPPDPRAARPDLPEALWSIVERCLAKSPEDRFASGAEVAAGLEALRSGAVPAAGGLRTAAAATPRRRARGRPRVAAAALIALAAALVAWVLFAGRGDSARSAGGRPGRETRISVLPFENLGPPQQGYFAAGVTEEITSRLAGVAGLAIVPVGVDEAQGTPIELGRRLGADYVLTGSVSWDGGDRGSSRVRIRPRLMQVDDGAIAWAEVYERVLEDVFAVQTEIALELLDQLGVALLTGEDVSERGRSTENLEAYNYYLQGVEYLNRVQETFSDDDLDLAVEMFRKAIAGDGDFALASAREAYAHALAYFRFWDRSLDRLQQAETLARRSLDLSPGLPEGHVALALVRRSELRYGEAIQELETARRARPNDSAILQMLGEIRWYAGDTDEAISLYTRAIEIDPRRGELHCSLGGVHMTAGDNEESVHSHFRAIDLRPDRACPYWCLGNLYLEGTGDTDRPRRYLEGLPADLDRDGWPPITFTLVALDLMDGNAEAALARLDQSPTDVYEFEQFFVPKAQVRAETLTLLGREAEARASFETALAVVDRRLADRPDDARLRSARGIALAGVGRFEEALAEAREGTRLMPFAQDVYSGPYRTKDLAQVLLMSGDLEGAVDELVGLLAVTSQIRLFEILLRPLWRPVATHPRFQESAQRYLASRQLGTPERL